LEYQRKIMADHRRSASSPSRDPINPDLENMLNQLDEALSTIPKSDRELILRYYSGSAKNKINHRRTLAQQLGINTNTLRLRVFRIKKEIKTYMLRSSTDIRDPLRLSA
jgi:DNA-directed RNA polymerase specialized sigma24 family protein